MYQYLITDLSTIDKYKNNKRKRIYPKVVIEEVEETEDFKEITYEILPERRDF